LNSQFTHGHIEPEKTVFPVSTGAGPGGRRYYLDSLIQEVSLRPIPYPYRAILAICSDLDETPDRHVYWEIMRFLNTTKETAMGPGIGLEVGNTVYFDMPLGQFSYWNTDEAGREMVRTLIRSGHIDCLHSYGDLATTRAHADRALDELSKHDCHLQVWVDHGVAPSNFGADIMCGLGDVPGSPVYHADLTCDFGIRYVWRGRITSMIGQDVKRSLRGIWNYRHPFGSGNTLLRESVKGLWARLGNEKYAMHGPNELMKETRLRSGQKVFEFIRSNPHWAGVSFGETADGFGDVMVESMLAELIKREGFCILYTHLGKIGSHDEPFSERTRMAMRLLAKYSQEGKVLVTTTRRLLSYRRALRELSISTSTERGHTKIDIHYDSPGENLDGLTVYMEDPTNTCLLVNGRDIESLRLNGTDQTGRRSISIPWRPLEFPPV
jgi:hypothetical protein